MHSFGKTTSIRNSEDSRKRMQSLCSPASYLSIEGINSVETLEQFFARLKKKYNWNDQGHVKEVVPHLRSRDINTVRVLKELWKDVKPELPLSIGMKLVMEEEIHKI